MTREEAIKVLQTYGHNCRCCAKEGLEASKIAIAALQEQEQKWILVTERLPEDGYGVLVTVNGKHNNITFENALEIAEYDNIEGWIIEGYLDWLDPDVTAWMPLPEPYKESKEE